MASHSQLVRLEARESGRLIPLGNNPKRGRTPPTHEVRSHEVPSDKVAPAYGIPSATCFPRAVSNFLIQESHQIEHTRHDALARRMKMITPTPL